MDKFVITGGSVLRGEIPTNGSKNSALPALAASLLTDEAVTLDRVPRVRDIRTMERLLVDIGTTVDVEGETVRLRAERILSPEAPYELVKTMRASSLVLGPLVARRNPANGDRGCVVPDGLRGAVGCHERRAVTGAQGLMRAAVLARRETV